MDSLCRKTFFVDGSLGRKQETVLVETKYDGQSLQEAKISGLVYTQCLTPIQDDLQYVYVWFSSPDHVRVTDEA